MANAINSNNQSTKAQDTLSVDEKLAVAMKVGNKPHITEQQLAANRWLLKRKLRAESLKKNSLVGRFSFVLETNKLQIVGMLFTFTFGFLLASNENMNMQAGNNPNNQIIENKHIQNQTTQPELVDPRDHIISFNIDKTENINRPFRVKFTTLRRTKLKTDFGDNQAILLLTSAMKTNLDDATRLELVDILKAHLENESVRESLSYALLNDPNPGVRMIIAESLAKLSGDRVIRETLRLSLLKDTNQGVRVSAFNGLLKYLDDKTIELFRTRGLKDSNYYIRSKAQNIIDEIQQKRRLEKHSI